MKKIVLLVLILLLLVSCNSNMVDKNLENKLSIDIADNIEEKDEIHKEILSIANMANNFSPIKNSKIIVSKKYTIATLDTELKCSPKFVGTEEFKKRFIKLAYGVTENWIVEGLYGNIFDSDYKDADFGNYYSDNQFSLFGSRFYKEFASVDEIKNLRAASTNLVKFLIENNKKDLLLSNDISIEDISDWAIQNNINLSHQEEIISLMNRFSTSYNTNFILELETVEDKLYVGNFKANYNIEIQNISDEWDTSEKIETMLLEFDINNQKIIEGIKTEANNFYNEYEDVFNNIPTISIIFDKSFHGGKYIENLKVIKLANLGAESHEYVHYLLLGAFHHKNVDVLKPIWLDEGLAAYIDLVHTDAMKFTYDDWDVNNEDNKKTNKVLILNNIDIADKEKNINDRNIKILMNDIAIIPHFQIKGLQISDIPLEYLAYQDGWEMGKGNYIGYFLNQSFNYFLIEKYGLEKLLYLTMEDFNRVSYEGYFGRTYEELKEDWLEYIKDNIKGIELLIEI